MKRLIIAFTLLLSVVSFSSFADEGIVSDNVLHSFKTSFRNATEVKWSTSSNLYKANFILNGQYLTAFYDGDGEMVAMTRNISSLQLPIVLQTYLKNNYEQFWISDLFEIANDQGTTYYVTLENADTKVILKSSGSEWIPYQKQRKS